MAYGRVGSDGGWVGGARDRLAKAKVDSILLRTERDEDGVDYEVLVRDLNEPDPAGDDADLIRVWYWRVNFGSNEQTRSGGYAFVSAAREQQAVADQVWAESRASKKAP
jgi:hypothetical protein